MTILTLSLDTLADAITSVELEIGHLTGRGYHRVRRVARTIADLDGAPDVVEEAHLNLALMMRVDLASGLRTRELMF